MKREAIVRNLRLLMLAGALALTLQGSAKYTANTHKAAAQSVVISSDVLKASVQIADSGSESTGGGKPKPHS